MPRSRLVDFNKFYYNLNVTRGGHEFRHESTGTRARGHKAQVLDMLIVAISNLSTNLDTEPSGNTKEADEEESEITIASVTNADQCQSPTNKNDSLEELPISESTAQQYGEEQSVPEQSA